MAKNYGCKNSGYVRPEKVGPHSGHVAHIIANVVSNCRRVTRIIFRDSCLHFPNQVSAHVCGFCVNATTNAGKQSDRFGTEGKTGKYLNGFCNIQ